MTPSSWATRCVESCTHATGYVGKEACVECIEATIKEATPGTDIPKVRHGLALQQARMALVECRAVIKLADESPEAFSQAQANTTLLRVHNTIKAIDALDPAPASPATIPVVPGDSEVSDRVSRLVNAKLTPKQEANAAREVAFEDAAESEGVSLDTHNGPEVGEIPCKRCGGSGRLQHGGGVITCGDCCGDGLR